MKYYLNNPLANNGIKPEMQAAELLEAAGNRGVTAPPCEGYDHVPALVDNVRIVAGTHPYGAEAYLGRGKTERSNASFGDASRQALEALLVLMVLDYITGLLAAYINPNLQLNSNRGVKGICKKIMILLLIVLAHELEKATGIPAVQSIVVWFFIGNEGLSIIENAEKAGIPVPAKLRDTLEQLQTEKKGAAK